MPAQAPRMAPRCLGRRGLLLAAAALLIARPALAAAAGAAALEGPAAAPAAAKKPLDWVAFQGSALLIFYYAGVVDSLLQCGAIKPGSTRIAGLSGGAFMAVFTTLGLNGTELYDLWKGMLEECESRYGICAGHLNVIAKERLAEILTPADVAKVNGKVRVAVSQLNGRSDNLNGSASWIVTAFRNQRDLAAALSGSGYIPCWGGQETYTLFRNQPVIDGGFSSGFEQLCPPGVKNCLKIGTYVVGPLANNTCDPTLCPLASPNCVDPERTDRKLTLYSNPAFTSDFELEAYRMRCLNGQPWNDTRLSPLPDWVPQSSTQPDLHPGKYNPLPEAPWLGGKRLIACQWQALSFIQPPNRTEAMQLEYKLGQDDAASWCAENGYAM